ncbi:hypothetical protein CEUSTIGMA_g11354.t1 [Chlamydomonas eustigma]|uniref:BTB domain-containing protein n=1 Tax=Chlamydomonas eustigma TaxID=1157962 RepID=A0A250XMB9_9CHLO|nr:hypothetical protein CEUSTIGMA_g11354.t1 [Chlamydomonas eustigma]|eukprot:GAX83930.1 hypothetical protein CEUSTIGMA_g11354.t1 [Chlamydomonas eustigma]
MDFSCFYDNELYSDILLVLRTKVVETVAVPAGSSSSKRIKRNHTDVTTDASTIYHDDITIPAHAMVLVNASPYFKARLSIAWQSTLSTLHQPDNDHSMSQAEDRATKTYYSCDSKRAKRAVLAEDERSTEDGGSLVHTQQSQNNSPEAPEALPAIPAPTPITPNTDNKRVLIEYAEKGEIIAIKFVIKSMYKGKLDKEWLQSDELFVHSENCVVALLSLWMVLGDNGKRCSIAESTELLKNIRVFQLSPSYLTCISDITWTQPIFSQSPALRSALQKVQLRRLSPLKKKVPSHLLADYQLDSTWSEAADEADDSRIPRAWTLRRRCRRPGKSGSRAGVVKASYDWRMDAEAMDRRYEEGFTSFDRMSSSPELLYCSGYWFYVGLGVLVENARFSLCAYLLPAIEAVIGGAKETVVCADLSINGPNNDVSRQAAGSSEGNSTQVMSADTVLHKDPKFHDYIFMCKDSTALSIRELVEPFVVDGKLVMEAQAKLAQDRAELQRRERARRSEERADRKAKIRLLKTELEIVKSAQPTPVMSNDPAGVNGSSPNITDQDALIAFESQIHALTEQLQNLSVEFVQAELEEGDEYAAGDGSSSAANTERSVSLSYHTAVPESGVGQVNPLIRQFNLGHPARIAVETVTNDSTPVPRSAMQPGAMIPQHVSNMSVMQPHPSGMQITPEVVDHQSGNPLAVRNQRGTRSFAFTAPVPLDQSLMGMPQHALTNPMFQPVEFVAGHHSYHNGTDPASHTSYGLHHNPVFQPTEFAGYPPPPPSRSAVSFQQVQNPPAPPMAHNPLFSNHHDGFGSGTRYAPDRNVSEDTVLRHAVMDPKVNVEASSIPNFSTQMSGLVTVLPYVQKMRKYIVANLHKLTGHIATQINLWLSSLVDPMQGVEFAYSHMEVIERMCPGATAWFDHIVSNLGMDVRSGVGETLNAIKALRSRVFDSLGNAVDRVKEDYAYPKKQLQFLEAWLQVVIKELCKPDAKELSIWARGMIMGKHNLLSHSVPAHEDPMTFFKRVGQTFTIFTTHSPKAFRAELHRASVQDVFISGLPDYLQRVAEDTMRRVGVLHHSEDIVNAFLVQDTQNAYEHVLRHETKGIMHKQAARMLPIAYMSGHTADKSLIPSAPNAPKTPKPSTRPHRPHGPMASVAGEDDDEDAVGTDTRSHQQRIVEQQHLASHSAQYPPAVHPRHDFGKSGPSVSTNSLAQSRPFTRLPPTCFICNAVGDHYSDKCPQKVQYMQYAEQGKKMVDTTNSDVAPSSALPTTAVLNAAAHAASYATHLTQYNMQQQMQRDAARQPPLNPAPLASSPTDASKRVAQTQFPHASYTTPASHSVQAEFVASLYEQEKEIESMMDLHAHVVSAYSLHAALSTALDPSPSAQAYFKGLPSKLFYFENNPDMPHESVGVVVKGQRCVSPASLLDFGSNCYLMAASEADRLGIQVHTLSVKLHTASGLGNIVGVTCPLIIEYGAAPHALHSSHCFIVIKDYHGMCFSMLFGNPDAFTFNAVHDVSAGLLHLSDRHIDVSLLLKACKPFSGSS